MNGMDAGEARFTFESSGYEGDEELRVLRFSGYEGISDLFRFGIELACKDAEIDLDAVVGQPARLLLHHADGARTIYGIISRFEQSVAGETFTPYYAELVPTVWLLTQCYRSRIFQNMTTQEIIEQCLTDIGIESDYYRFALQSSYDPRVYCVQYRETYWNFIARLMEEEGIFFFFEHADEKDVLVMADSDSAHEDIEGESAVLYRPRSGAVEAEEFIYDFRYSQQVRTGKYAVKDFNFETPSLGLLKEDEADRNPELEVYEFPGLHATDDRGQTIAELRLEMSQALRLQGQGRGICRRFAPGYKFSLEDFPRADLNQDYLLVSIQHEGVQPLGQDDAGGHYEYNNHFRAIPADVPFRPARKTPKPVVEGTQTAIVTGPSGEEIYVDEYGRVKVQFHWDRDGQMDENTSCWIRVSQLWAGQGWGAMWIPRIGHEVIVDFIEGDPDRPIIVGRVYHAENTVPYTLDDEKTKSTIKSNSSKGGGGSNEYRFEDKKGEEEIFQHAQKDLLIVTENDKTQNTGHDEKLTIGNDRTKEVKANEKTTVHKNRTEEVLEGDEKITIKTGDRIIDVNTGDNKLTVKTGDRIVDVNTGDDKLTVKTGDRIVDVNTGDDKHTIKTGDHKVAVNAGDDTLDVKSGKKKDQVKGPYEIVVTTDKFKITCGSSELVLNQSGLIEIKGADINIKGKKDIMIAGMNIQSKASVSNNTEGKMVMSKAAAMNVIKGGMVQLNPPG
jgi:type VI secretion system secreted protein VgrG